jgi:predicted DCC family thiol-disulfide oxidoreductase YuxK
MAEPDVNGLPPGIAATDRVVLFDGECVLCSSGAQLLIRADRHRVFKLGTVQSPEGQRILAWHNLPTGSFDTFVLVEGPRIYVRSTAYVRIVSRLAFPWKLGSIMWVIPRPLRDWLYNIIARNRYRWFGKRERCILLTPDHQSRLLGISSDRE